MIIQASGAVIDGSLRADTWIETVKGKIVSVSAGKHSNPDKLIDGILIPGFIDIHCHGGANAYFQTLPGLLKSLSFTKSMGRQELLPRLSPKVLRI